MPIEQTLIVNKENLEEEEQEYAGEYVIRRWKWGDKSRAVAKAVIINARTGEVIPDPAKLNLETLNVCLVKAPFKHSKNNPNISKLDNMPAWLGDELMAMCQIVNRTMDDTRKKNS